MAIEERASDYALRWFRRPAFYVEKWVSRKG